MSSGVRATFVPAPTCSTHTSSWCWGGSSPRPGCIPASKQWRRTRGACWSSGRTSQWRRRRSSRGRQRACSGAPARRRKHQRRSDRAQLLHALDLPRPQGDPHRELRERAEGPQSRRPRGVGDVAGERGDRLKAFFSLLLLGVVLSVAACGGDEDRADTTRSQQPPTTTDAPTFQTNEASTPGSGGFIETPQVKVDEAAARDAPDTSRARERQIYGQAKAACAGFPKKVARRNLTLFAVRTLGRGDKTRRRVAMEGCRAGLK